MTTLGSLCTGYGGLDMGVMTALDPSARVAWTSDIEAGPCKLAAIRSVRRVAYGPSRRTRHRRGPSPTP